MPRSIHVSATDTFFPFYDWVIFHSTYVSHLLYPFLCWWTFSLFPCPGYCKWCCGEYWDALPFKNNRIYLLLCWVFATHGLSLVMVNGSFLLFRCQCFALQWHLLWRMGSRALGHQELWCTRLAAPWHVGSSRTRDWTCVPALAGSPIYCTTWEGPECIFLNHGFSLCNCPGVGLLGHMVVLFLVF